MRNVVRWSLPVAAAAVVASSAAGFGPKLHIGPKITAAGPVVSKPVMTLEGARAVIAAAVAKARSADAGGAIAVVDDGGNLIAFERLDGTFPAGAPVSIGKARTAAMFKKPTRVFEEAIKNGRTALVGVSEMTPLQGGVPIMFDGEVVGGIGVSGAHSQAEDELIAMAGAAAITPPSAAR